MSLRYTEAEAAQLGIRVRKDGTAVIERAPQGQGASTGTRKKGVGKDPLARIARLSPPHAKLWAAVFAIYGDRAKLEFKSGVGGRRFSSDIAIPDRAVAIEIDGYQSHGKTLAGFKADRERQNVFAVGGWYVLRFFPGEINNSLSECLATIAAAHDAPYGRAVARLQKAVVRKEKSEVKPARGASLSSCSQ